MTSRLSSVTFDAVEPRVVADFWCAVLGWIVLDEEPDIVSIGPADGGWPTIDVIGVPDGKQVKNRLHLDLRADGSERDLELQRLLDLGAGRVDVGQGPEVSWVVLADPEGNEFCLLSLTVDEALAEQALAGGQSGTHEPA